MVEKNDYVLQKDGYKSTIYRFFTSKEPKSSILILHGMAEHHKRYYSFAKILADNGVDVFLYDHRGHGEDTLLKDLGFISDFKGYEKLIQDASEILEYVHRIKRSKKVFLLGHSMGSLVARCLSQSNPAIDGLILCGTTHPALVKTKAGLFLTTLVKRAYGPKHLSPFLNQVLFGSRPYSKLLTKTSFDWLTRNKQAVEEYIHDPYCGFICTISFYQDLLKLASLATTPKRMRLLINTLPLLVISGDKDPVGGYGKEVTQMINYYRKWGYAKITEKLYLDCRHELLQEINSDEIIKDILDWLRIQ